MNRQESIQIGGLRMTARVVALMWITLVAASPAFARYNGNDWHRWRGADDLGISRATGLVDSWTKDDGNIVWQAEVGGRSTPIIMDGRVYVIRLTGEGPTWKEEVVCLNESDGEILWRHAFDIFQTDIPTDRVGWTSLAGDPETGFVYAHGVQGVFLCLDKKGKVVWERSLTEEFGRISGYGGRTHTPIIDGDKVIVSFLNSGLGAQGVGRHRYLAMDKRTGEVIYWATPGGQPLDTTFSVPTVAVINGVRQLIAANADGWVYGMKAETGEKIWGFQLSKRGLNASVVVQGDKAYAMHSEDNVDIPSMGRIVCIDVTGEGDVTKTHEVWRNEGFRGGYASPALAEGRLYALDNGGTLICLDAETGEEFWSIKIGKIAWGSPVWADGKIYVPEVDGGFHIVRAGETDAEILSSIHFEHPEIPLVDIRGCPAIANGRLYVLTRTALYCVSDGKHKPQTIAVPELPSVGKGEGPATHARVVPGEIHINPGEKAKFSAHLFDAKGRPLGEPKDVEWSQSGLQGKLTKNSFVADEEPNGQFGLVKATIGELSAEARVRVNTRLPIVEDFESFEADGAGPHHWLGAPRVKFHIIEEDGNKMLRKDADDPRFTRADIYVGPWTMRDYTIQVDMRGQEKRRRLPDMGVYNNRYQIDLQGTTGEMRIVSWIPMPRLIKTIPYEMEPGVWYRLKARVDHGEDGATVRAKLWPRGEEEPDAWTLELEDPAPPASGPPGLASFAMGEIDYDNLSVTPSEPLAP